MTNTVYTVSSTPTILAVDKVRKNMRDILIALIPSMAFGIHFLGTRVIWIALISITACIVSEAVWQKAAHREITTGDLSAVVTGLFIALNLPPSVPLWIPFAGGAFAIIFVKQFFGGLGQNFMNPSLAARAFLLASWAGPMTKAAVDAAASATDAVASASQAVQAAPGLWEVFVGGPANYIGETSVLALLIGGLYLVLRRTISPRIPASYIGTVFVLFWILKLCGINIGGEPVRLILSAGLVLGSFFMATDHSTSPTTPSGQYIMGAGCGILTAVFNVFGHNPEGFVYAILIMNLLVPFIEKYTSKGKPAEVK